jgi:hypothetical protein
LAKVWIDSERVPFAYQRFELCSCLQAYLRVCSAANS